MCIIAGSSAVPFVPIYARYLTRGGNPTYCLLPDICVQVCICPPHKALPGDRGTPSPYISNEEVQPVPNLMRERRESRSDHECHRDKYVVNKSMRKGQLHRYHHDFGRQLYRRSDNQLAGHGQRFLNPVINSPPPPFFRGYR